VDLKGFLRVFALAILFSISIVYEIADAQMVGYPQRFRLTGLIELNYRDYSIEATSGGRKFETGFSIFEQRYQIGLEGYIYHPRLIVFSTKLDYNYSMFKNDLDMNTKDIGYEIYLTFLPYRPVSLDIYASKVDFTAEGISTPMETTTNQYGARLRLSNLWKLPSMKFEYYHMDMDTNYFSSKFETNWWNFNMNGSMSPIKTNYGLAFGFGDLSSTSRSYNSKRMSWNSSTKIRNTTLLTYLFSYDEDLSKQLSYGALLIPQPGKRFIQDYRYEYYDDEYHVTGIGGEETGEIIKTADRVFTGTWSYRFTERLYGSLSLDYGLHKEADNLYMNEANWTYYGAVPSIDYRRPIAGLDFLTHYFYFLRKDEKKGESKEHNLELGLEARRFRFGTIYADYYFLKSDSIDKLYAERGDIFAKEEVFKKSTAKTTSHLFRTGIRGRLGQGPSRGSWNIEGQYLYSSSSGKRPITTLDQELIVEWSRKTSQYILFGELTYPLGRGATVHLKAGYNTAKNDSRRTNRFYFDERFTYPISRRLSFAAWWMEIWDKIEGGIDRKIRDYEVFLTYRVGMVFFSLEYEGIREEENSRIKDTKRLFIKLRRPFY